jgi:UDP-3-O-[3-hydroxymyristoyl] glucosamine N-acyltransferase
MISLSDLCKVIGAKLIGAKNAPVDSSITITGFAELEDATANQIAFLSNKKYLSQLKNTQANAVILEENFLANCPVTALVVSDAYLAFAQATHFFSYRPSSVQEQKIHPKSYIDESVVLPKNVQVDAGAVIEEGCCIGDGTVIRANAVLSKNVILGEHCYIDINASILHDCVIGNHCVIGPGSVIGSEGFGTAWDKQKNTWCSIHHQGKVVIGDNVEIGANNAIDRGTIKDTIIESGVRMDNLIMMAHNSVIGQDTALAGQVGMAGQTTIGKRVKVAGQVGFSGHVEIADDRLLMGKSMVTGSIKEKGVYAGYPHQKIELWRREVAMHRRQLKQLYLDRKK